MEIRLQKQGQFTRYEYDRVWGYKSDSSNNFNDVIVQEGGHYVTRTGWVNATTEDVESLYLDTWEDGDIYLDKIRIDVTEEIKTWLKSLDWSTDQPYREYKISYDSLVGLDYVPEPIKTHVVAMGKYYSKKWMFYMSPSKERLGQYVNWCNTISA